MPSRRKCIASTALAGLSALAFKPFRPGATDEEMLAFHSPFMRVVLDRRKPPFSALTADRLLLLRGGYGAHYR
jgi:hypothetical protein